MIRQFWIALVLLLLFATSVAAQVKGPVTFSIEVLPGNWKAVRLRNLPKNSVIACRVQTSGEVMMSFLDADDYKQFPVMTRPLFSGRVEKQLAFSLRIPSAGHYFVVFDNRSGKESRRVTVTIKAARGRQKDGSRSEPTAFRSRLYPGSPLS